MYGIPPELNLDFMVGSETTQIRVGQHDVQFTFGKVDFRVQSRIVLSKNGIELGAWESGKWPDASFFEVMNVPVSSVQVQESKIIRINLVNGVSLKILDDSDQFETIQIVIDGEASWIV
jgi:hypothetical protein